MFARIMDMRRFNSANEFYLYSIYFFVASVFFVPLQNY